MQQPIFIVYTGELPAFANIIIDLFQKGGAEGVCVPLVDAQLLNSSRVIAHIDVFYFASK